MPIEHDTEDVEVTKTKTTTRYVCDVEGCDSHTEHRDPKGDKTVANGEPDHDIHYVSLDPYTGHRPGVIGAKSTVEKLQLKDHTGVYVCEKHLSKAGELLIEESRG